MTEFKHISVAETAEKIAADAVTICDIRDPDSFAAGHIANAFHLSDQSMVKLLNEVDFSRPVVVVCYHGHSSQGAAEYLAQQGFEEVYSMDGGFVKWAQEQPSVS
ncbi:MAG: thiosulfate sulfurtransferase [Phenylobacterium sp.]|jgi:thiosulfate sulfurtransferase